VRELLRIRVLYFLVRPHRWSQPNRCGSRRNCAPILVAWRVRTSCITARRLTSDRNHSQLGTGGDRR
jgi:hypothetical protein